MSASSQWCYTERPVRVHVACPWPIHMCRRQRNYPCLSYRPIICSLCLHRKVVPPFKFLAFSREWPVSNLDRTPTLLPNNFLSWFLLGVPCKFRGIKRPPALYNSLFTCPTLLLTETLNRQLRQHHHLFSLLLHLHVHRYLLFIFLYFHFTLSSFIFLGHACVQPQCDAQDAHVSLCTSGPWSHNQSTQCLLSLSLSYKESDKPFHFNLHFLSLSTLRVEHE